MSGLFCRNYLEYVAESVADWMQEEEAKYSAHLLSRELDKMQQDEDAAAKAAELAAKKGKKSPRKSPSESILVATQFIFLPIWKSIFHINHYLSLYMLLHVTE